MNESACLFFDDLGRRIGDISCDSRETSSIFQLLSVRSGDIRSARRFGLLAIPHLFLDFFVFNPWDLYYQWYKIIVVVVVVVVRSFNERMFNMTSRAESQYATSNVWQTDKSDSDGSQTADGGRLFQIRGPTMANVRSPKVVLSLPHRNLLVVSQVDGNRPIAAVIGKVWGARQLDTFRIFIFT